MEFAREKRNHPRIPTKFALKYRLLQDGPQKFQHAQSLDLSKGGMSFRSPEFIPHHTSALIEFTPPNQHNPIRLVSEVVHTIEHAAGNHFTIGIKFQHMMK